MKELIGEYITVWCLNYIYGGKLVAVGDNDIQLTDACVVYETGELTGSYKTAQKLGSDWFIRTGCIESYGKYNGKV